MEKLSFRAKLLITVLNQCCWKENTIQQGKMNWKQTSQLQNNDSIIEYRMVYGLPDLAFMDA